MPVKPIRLAVVDDHAMFRKTLCNYLSEQKDLAVVIQSPDIASLQMMLRNCPTDVILMDVFMPHMNGSDGLKIIRTEYPDVQVLILSMSTDLGLIGDMLEAGIHGYISKIDEPDELLQAIRVVSPGRIYRNKWFTEALYWNKENSIKGYTDRSPTSISEREKRILQLIWEEKSNKEIADSLFLGVRSVEKIRQDMKEKLGIKSTVGLLKYYCRKDNRKQSRCAEAFK